MALKKEKKEEKERKKERRQEERKKKVGIEEDIATQISFFLDAHNQRG
ncbi:hypothetical protein [Bartonella sp. AC140YNZD]